MVKVSILGSTGIIGKNVAFTLARADTVDEIVFFARPHHLDIFGPDKVCHVQHE